MLLAALAAGCVGGPDSTSATDEGQAIRGRIVDLKAGSLLEIESLTMRGESGETYTGGVALGRFTPSHPREHMVSGVVVAYHEEKGRLVPDAISG